MTPFAQVIADLMADPAPVLFLDTCALLDITRGTARHPGNVAAAAAVHAAAGVRTVVSDLTPGEFADNRTKAREEAERGIGCYAATWQAAAARGLHPAGLPPAPPTLPFLIDELDTLAGNLLAGAVVLGRDVDAMSWAIDRAAHKPRLRPSKGKGEVKDCHIVGHAIRLSHQVGTGSTRPRVFVSSNTDDFAAPNGLAVHPDLAADFQAAGLAYAVSLHDAVLQLRAAGVAI